MRNAAAMAVVMFLGVIGIATSVATAGDLTVSIPAGALHRRPAFPLPRIPLKQASDTLQPPLRLRNFCHPQAKVAIDQHHLAAGHDLVPHDQLDRVAHMAVELNHVARPQIENLRQRHLPRAKPQRGLQLHIQQQVQPDRKPMLPSGGARRGTLAGRRDDSDFLTDSNFGNTLLLPNRNLDGAYQRLA